MQYCTNCGKPSSDGAKFCDHCGNPFNPIATKHICQKCGISLKKDEKFCSGCGSPVTIKDQTTAPVNPSPPTTPSSNERKKEKYTKEGRKIIDSGPRPTHGASTKQKPTAKRNAPPPNKNKKKGCFGCLGKSIIGILVVLIVGVVVIYNLPDSETEGTSTSEISEVRKQKNNKSKKYVKPKFSAKSVLAETTVNTDSTEVIIKASDQVTVILPIALLDDDERLVVKELKPVKMPNGQNSDIVIDIELGDQHTFDDFIEILIDPPPNFDPKHNIVQCLSMSSGDKNWQPVMAFYEPDIDKVKIVTDHLSSFALTLVSYGATEVAIDQMHTVAIETYKYFRTITQSDAVSILEGYNTERVSKTLNKDYHVLSWNTVMDVYGLAGTGLSFLENGAGISGLSNIGKAAGNIGIGLSVIQIALDAYNGKVTAAQVGIYKTFLNTVVSKGFNTRAMNLALIGVFAIDYSLTTFANEAWGGRKALYETIWDNYQQRQRKKKINLRWWKKEIMTGMRKAKDPSKFESVVEGIITNYIKEFWDDETEIALIQSEVGPIFSAGGGLNKKMKDELSADFRLQILQYLQSLLTQLQKKYIYQSQKELRLQYVALAKELNREQLIHCMMGLIEDEEPDIYEGFKVMFDVPGKELKRMWQGEMNKDAEMDFFCTTAGYIGAGSPISATLFIPDKTEDGKFEEVKASVDLKKARKTTIVEFKKIPSNILNAAISIDFEGTEKVSYNGNTNINEDFAQNMFGEISFKNYQINGNTISADQKYKDSDGSNFTTSISLTFKDMKNPVELLSFSLKSKEEKSGNNQMSGFVSATGSNIPFLKVKEDNKIVFYYEGDIRKYITDFKYNSEHSTGIAGIHEIIKLNSEGSIQILVEYK